MKQIDKEKDSKKQSLLAFNKKSSQLKNKILIEFGIVALLFVVLIMAYLKLSKTKTEGGNELKELTSYVANLKTKSADIQAKINDTKKYKQVWQKSSEIKKKLDGIKANDLNTTFTKLAEEYNMLNPTIKISIPETLKTGIFNTQALEVMFSSVSVSFEAVSDVIAVNFAKELTENIPGYHIISTFSIKKTKDNYQEKELIDISSGKISGAISGKMDIYWYAFKKKGQDFAVDKKIKN